MPPQPSTFEKVVIKLPKSLQQFIRSMQRKFGKETNDDEFKNLVATPDPKATDIKSKKTDLKGSKLVNGGPKVTPRQSTVLDLKSDKTKTTDKSKAGKDKKDTGGKSQLPDNSKQIQAQQNQQATVGTKTNQLAINPKQPAGKDAKESKDVKEPKDSKRKKDSTPVQVQPVIIPGTVPPSEPKENKKSKKEKKSRRKGKSRRNDDDDDDNDFDSNDDIDEDDEDEDEENVTENDDENETVKDSDDEDDDITEPNDSFDEDNDSEVDTKKKKKNDVKKSNSKSKPKKKKKVK
jgi:hypothetical protein